MNVLALDKLHVAGAGFLLAAAPPVGAARPWGGGKLTRAFDAAEDDEDDEEEAAEEGGAGDEAVRGVDVPLERREVGALERPVRAVCAPLLLLLADGLVGAFFAAPGVVPVDLRAVCGGLITDFCVALEEEGDDSADDAPSATADDASAVVSDAGTTAPSARSPSPSAGSPRSPAGTRGKVELLLLRLERITGESPPDVTEGNCGCEPCLTEPRR